MTAVRVEPFAAERRASECCRSVSAWALCPVLYYMRGLFAGARGTADPNG